MDHYTVKRYETADAAAWNAFVAASKNGTFLFDRGFMDYHANRFQDHSLMVYDASELLAILPAHVVEDCLYSHWGLTYGGLVYNEKAKLKEIIGALRSILRFLLGNKIESLYIKAIPSIYHLFPADELLYALFLANARLTRRDSLSVIDLSRPLAVAKTRRESIRRGEKNRLEIREEANFRPFWDEILIPNLSKKHDVKPVHSVSEIEMLQRKFPENIRHFNVYDNGKIVAGTTVFISRNVAHPQYISGNENKNELGSLDYLYHVLITDVFKDKRFFDFGISNEEQGRKLNEGLVFWKESFGAQTVTQDFYQLPTVNYKRLENVLI